MPRKYGWLRNDRNKTRDDPLRAIARFIAIFVGASIARPYRMLRILMIAIQFLPTSGIPALDRVHRPQDPLLHLGQRAGNCGAGGHGVASAAQ